MIEFPRKLKQLPEGKPMPANARRVGYVEGAIGDADRVARVAALFPNVVFESVGPRWPDRYSSHFDILIVFVDSQAEIGQALGRLKARPPGLQFLLVLRRPDSLDASLLAGEGGADILSAPVSDAAVALSIERLLTRETAQRGSLQKPGQMVAFLKAGGGVGATSLAVQIAAMLAGKSSPAAQVCLADLDLQFGNAALYFDLRDALTVADCLPVGDVLDETQFATALATHKSGARILAAPRQPTALDALSPQLAESLVAGLKRDFALTLLDLPAVWTPWTYRVLQLADRIVIVTRLSVPHVHLVRRQLGVLGMQKLDDRPVLLVCNAASAEEQKAISVKAAQRAIGRDFDFVIPEDSATMIAAINQGVAISDVRRGTKVERGIRPLADALAADALAGAAARMRG
ncbi:MAG TPA: hypothetical protein VGI20_01355 [Rhizomicrobium sp.]